MAWPTLFQNLASGNQPLALFDTMFNQVAQLVAIPCTSTGNALYTLTLIGNAPTITSYNNFQMFRFKATAASAGAVTVQFGSLAALPVFKVDGVTQCGAGDIINGQEYLVVFDQSRNGGVGGFYLETAGQPVTVNPNAPIESFGYMNLVYNGEFRHSQFNGSNSVNLVTNVTQYITDGWTGFFHSSTLTFQASQNFAVPDNGYAFCLSLNGGTGGALAAADYILLTHPVEGTRMLRLAWGFSQARSITIGFWVQASITGTFTLALRNALFNRAYLVNLVVTAPNTYQYYSVTIPGDTAGTWNQGSVVALYISFCFGTGTNAQGSPNAWLSGSQVGTSSTTNFFATNGNSVQITGVTAFAGTIGPSSTTAVLAQRHIDDELRICQRYYSKSFPQGTVPAQNAGNAGNHTMVCTGPSLVSIGVVTYPVIMRATPGLISYNPAAANANPRNFTISADYTGTNFGAGGDRSFYITAIATAGMSAGQDCQVHWTADARL
jgi:hypothetical protein